MKKITKAIIPAAGLGTRFLPITKNFPKEMLPIIEIPNIQYLLKEAKLSNIKEVLIIISKNKNSIKQYFKKDKELIKYLQEKNKINELELIKNISSIKVKFAYQDKPLGLGHAILQGEDFVKGEDFGVLLGDDLVDYDTIPAIKELIDNYYKCNNSTQLGCKKVDKKDLSKYGVVKPKDEINDKCFEIDDMIEKPKDESLMFSNVATVGRYVLTNGIFDAIRKTSPGVGGEIQLTDAIRILMKKEKVFASIFTGKRYDIGDKFGYIEAIIDYSLKREELKEKVLNYIKNIK